MKKIVFILITLLMLASCSKKDVKVIIDYNYSDMGIVAPSGAPSLAFMGSLNDSSFETNANPKNILSMMTSNSDKRVVVIDTLSGLKAIKEGAPYKLAANITFGNFYIASTGNDDNASLDSDDKIILFGQGTTPDVIFHYLYGNTFDENIEYVASVSDAGKCLAAGKNLESGNVVDYVFIAEPILTNVLSNKDVPTYGKAYSFINVQDEYYQKLGSKMIQASVFIKDDGYISDFADYSNYLKNNIELILNNKDYVNTLLENKSDEEISSIFGINKNMIQKVLETNSVGLGYVKASDNKKAIDTFIKLFGMEETSEDIYCK